MDHDHCEDIVQEFDEDDDIFITQSAFKGIWMDS